MKHPSCLALALMACAPLVAQTTFEERRDWLLGRNWDVTVSHGKPNYGGPKNGMPHALVHLYQSDGANPFAVSYLARVLTEYTNDNHFEPLGVVRALYMYGEQLSPEQRESLRRGAQLRKDWARASGTENHRLGFMTNGYLLAQQFDNGSWHASSQLPAVSSAELRAILKTELLEEGRFRYASGSEEFLSPNYLIHHVTPLLNLYDFADDSELVAMAEALLAYHLTHLALNVHDGYVLEPHARLKGPQQVGSLGASNATLQMNWLYWGLTDVSTSSVASLRPLVYLAVSDFRPWPLLQRIATGNVQQPFVTRSTTPNAVNAQDRAPGRNKRSVYRAQHYAIGAGGFKHIPDGHYLDRSHFGISWTTDDKLNSLQVAHPYWYADGHPWEHQDIDDTANHRPWWDAPASPFQQTVHHENSAIVLFQIPDAATGCDGQHDPWAGRGRADWWAYRDERAQFLRKNCLVRFPETVDQVVIHNVAGQTNVRWYFLREGDAYIGIRTLFPSYSWILNPSQAIDDRFRLIQSYGPRCGFVFEVNAAEDFPQSSDPFADFRNALAAGDETQGHVVFNPSAAVFQASYTNLSGDTLRLEYIVSNDEADPGENVTNTFPRAFVNGARLDFDAWPLISTPAADPDNTNDAYALMDNSILEVRYGGEQLRVDWSSELPIVTTVGVD